MLNKKNHTAFTVYCGESFVFRDTEKTSGKNRDGEKIPSLVLQHSQDVSSLNESWRKKKLLLLWGINFGKEQSNEHFAEHDTVHGMYK